MSQLREIRGLHPDRAPVIVAGTLVVAEALRHFGLDELEVSEHDLLHGAALAAAELPAHAEGPRHRAPTPAAEGRRVRRKSLGTAACFAKPS